MSQSSGCARDGIGSPDEADAVGEDQMSAYGVITRRDIVAAAFAAAGLFPVLGASGDGAQPMRLVLLGTAGGPRPRKTRSAPAQAIVIGDRAYVIDCGDGVARQLALANIPLDSLRGVFITHQHSDHTADYGNLLLLAWTAGLRTRVDCFGPAPLARMTRLYLEMNSADIDMRIKDEGRVALQPLVHVHEIEKRGAIFEDDLVRVSATLVDHPPVVPSFAYRFDSASGSVVISGDTRYSENLIALAKGADVLVHEVMLVEGVERLVSNVRNASDLKRSIIAHHTSAEDVGRVAAAARVKKLVLSHFVPAEDAELPERAWIEPIRRHYDGPIIVGTDLLSIDVNGAKA
jgi:ribonuclease BN (tRNA processing enzyme)